MNQQGVTFLEVVVVVAILLIVTSLVSPNIQGWRQKKALESDFYAVLAQIDYLKTRARTLNGTAILTCASNSGRGTVMGYQVSTNPQTSVIDLAPGFAANVVENPTAKSVEYNLLSGKTVVVSDICSGKRGIILASGQVGVEGSGQALMIDIEPEAGKLAMGAYRIVVNATTGFIQKYKWQLSAGRWAEID